MAEMMTRRSTRHAIDPTKVHEFVESLIGEDYHAQRVFSLATGVVGVIHAATASVHAIGLGFAVATGREPRHAVKQIDRLLSNRGIKLWDLFGLWVPFVLGGREEAVVALDWTEFDADGQATIALNLITSHGRATPLMWKTHLKSKLRAHRNLYEDELLKRFREIIPPSVRITLLADRGFGDQALYKALDGAHIDFVIRFRGSILVESGQGEHRTAAEWVPPNGRALKIDDARVTSDKTPVAAVVCTKARNMKEAWILASSHRDCTASQIVTLYARRFTIEENFRDTKDLRFGLGLSATHIGTPERRDRLLFLIAVAQALLTLLGAAVEHEGLDRHTKVNTVKRRTHSLYRQGWMWYQMLPTLRDEWLQPLMRRFGELVSQHATFTELFGIL